MQQYSLSQLDQKYNQLIIDLKLTRFNIMQEHTDEKSRYITDIEYAIKRI